MGTKWDVQIGESIAPELLHFARTGIAAISSPSAGGGFNGEQRDLFDSNIFEYLETHRDLVASRTSQLHDRGIGVIAAVTAASDLQACLNTVADIEFGKIGRTSNYCLPVSAADAKGETGVFDDAFHLQESASPLWVGISYEQQGNGKELTSPKGLVLAAEVMANQTDNRPKCVYAVLTFSDRPFDNRVEIQAAKGSHDRGCFPRPFIPDPDLRAIKAFTRVINRTLQNLNRQ